MNLAHSSIKHKSGSQPIIGSQLESFFKLTTELELFGIGKQTLTRTNEEEQETNKVCKHWNKGFASTKIANFIITQSTARFTLISVLAGIENAVNNTKKYCYQGGCDRRGQCAYLHQDTQASVRTYKSQYRSYSRNRS